MAKFTTTAVSLLLPIAAVTSIAVALNLWAIKNPHRTDFTTAEVYSLSDASKALISQLEKPISITYFYDSRSRAMLDARHLLQQYADASSMITLQSHDPILEPAAAERYGVRFAGTSVFSSDGRSLSINEPGEHAFTNALIRVTSNDRGEICFTDGHIESNPFSLQSHDHMEHGSDRDHGHDHSGGQALTLHERHGMGMAKNALETLGYRVVQRLLLQQDETLKGCSVVVVASPQVPFSSVEAGRLQDFIRGGGKALVMLEPDVKHGLDDILTEFGIALSRQRVHDPAQHYWTDASTPAVSDYQRHRVTRQLALSFFPGVAEIFPLDTLDPSTVRVIPLANTSPLASLITGESDDNKRPRTLVLLAEHRRHHGALGIVGDGDFATNSFFSALGNGQLFLNLIAELSADEAALDIAPKEYVVASLELDNRALRASFMITTLGGPALMLMLGAWVWWRRR